KPFLQDYSLMKIQPEVISQAYLAGRGERSYFDARSIYYLGLSAYDDQNQLPVIRPVIDYSNTLKYPVFGGEVGYHFNLTSLSRPPADFHLINPSLATFTSNALTSGPCALSADPAFKVPGICLLRGVPGDFTRTSADAMWRRTIIDP